MAVVWTGKDVKMPFLKESGYKIRPGSKNKY